MYDASDVAKLWVMVAIVSSFLICTHILQFTQCYLQNHSKYSSFENKSLFNFLVVVFVNELFL